MKINSPIKYHGGKHYLATRIVAMMPPHIHFVEPFFGGGSVLLAKPESLVEGHSEVINDIDGDLTNFWLVLQEESYFAKFKRLVEAVPFSEVEYNMSSDLELVAKYASPIYKALAFFIKARMSLAGRMKGFTSITKTRVRRGMNAEASAWLTSVEGLPEVHARLKRVLILSREAVDVIKQQDSPNTLYYLDPPYMLQTRVAKDVYEHEMTTEQHEELLKTLSVIEGKFILSGYRSELYDEYAANFNWHRVDINIPNSAAGGEKKKIMVESLWTNFKVNDTEIE